MVDQVKCFSKIYKHRSNNIPTVYTRHSFVYQFYKCCLTAMFLAETRVALVNKRIFIRVCHQMFVNVPFKYFLESGQYRD